MSLLYRFDHWMCDRVFQRAADWIQERAGLDCFKVALGFLFLAMLPRVAYWLIYGWHLAFVILDLLATGVCLLLIEQDRISVHRYGVNIGRITNFFMRNYFLAVTFFWVPMGWLLDDLPRGMLSLADAAGMSTAMYFSSCTPRPPKPRRQEEEEFAGGAARAPGPWS